MKSINELFEQAKEITKHTYSGIYFLFDGNELVYVGRAINVYHRVHTHVTEGRKSFDQWAYVDCPVDKLDDLEAAYISEFRPKYNSETTYLHPGFAFRKEIRRRFKLSSDVFEGICDRFNIERVGHVYDGTAFATAYAECVASGLFETLKAEEAARRKAQEERWEREKEPGYFAPVPRLMVVETWPNGRQFKHHV